MGETQDFRKKLIESEKSGKYVSRESKLRSKRDGEWSRKMTLDYSNLVGTRKMDNQLGSRTRSLEV